MWDSTKIDKHLFLRKMLIIRLNNHTHTQKCTKTDNILISAGAAKAQ